MALLHTVAGKEMTPTEYVRFLKEQSVALDNLIRPRRIVALRLALVKNPPEKSKRNLLQLIAQFDEETRRLQLRSGVVDDLLDQIEAFVEPVEID